MSIGIPVKLLHESEGHVVTVELKTGEVYRGKLDQAEDNMNMHMSNIILTRRDGSTQPLEHVFVRGSHVRFLILPDMLKVRNLVLAAPSALSRPRRRRSTAKSAPLTFCQARRIKSL